MVTESDLGSKSNFFSKYLSVTRVFSSSQLRESLQQPQLWYHFVFKVNFGEGFLQANIFRGLLTQRFWYHLIGFYMRRRLLHL